MNVIFLCLFIIFIGLLLNLLCATDFSQKVWEPLYPVIGTVALGIFFLLKIYLTAFEKNENYMDFAAILMKNNNEIVSPVSIFLTDDPNIQEHRLYFNMAMKGMFFPYMYPDNVLQSDRLDFFEYMFLSGLRIGIKEQDAGEDYSLKQLINKNSENTFIHFPLKEIQKKLKDPGKNLQTNQSNYDSLKNIKIRVPKNTTVRYEYQKDSRRYVFDHKYFQVEIILSDGGRLNFVPNMKPFHLWIIKPDLASTYIHHKFTILINFQKKKYFEYANDSEVYEGFYNSIIAYAKNDLSWKPVLEKLKKNYQLSLLERRS